jgi:hypothetical protein
MKINNLIHARFDPNLRVNGSLYARKNGNTSIDCPRSPASLRTDALRGQRPIVDDLLLFYMKLFTEFDFLVAAHHSKD